MGKGQKISGKQTESAQLTLADLVSSPSNPRKISREALRGLQNSLARFGDISGLVWNKRSGHLVAGHQRMAALRAKHGDALRIEGGAVVTPDGERFPVRVVDWDLETEQLANLSANNTAVQGQFDDRKLATVLDGLKDRSEDLEALRLGELVRKLGQVVETPEVEFAEELLLEHNYIVLYFDNPFDWQVAQEVFGLKPAKDLKPRKGQPTGTGRVVRGAPWLERLAAGGSSK